jgi:hypothetical protein
MALASATRCKETFITIKCTVVNRNLAQLQILV